LRAVARTADYLRDSLPLHSVFVSSFPRRRESRVLE
jgi:hypothetical protein